MATAAGVTPEMRAACPSVAGWIDVSFSRISCDRPGISQPPCSPEGDLRLLEVCGALHTRMQPSVAMTVLTVPSSHPACVRTAPSGWPRSAARHPTPGLPGSARPPAACVRSAGHTTSRLARGWGCGQWPPQPQGCIPHGTVAQ
jgi:hypothetical protein